MSKKAPPGFEPHRIVHRLDGWIDDPVNQGRAPRAVAEMIFDAKVTIFFAQENVVFDTEMIFPGAPRVMSGSMKIIVVREKIISVTEKIFSLLEKIFSVSLPRSTNQ